MTCIFTNKKTLFIYLTFELRETYKICFKSLLRAHQAQHFFQSLTFALFVKTMLSFKSLFGAHTAQHFLKYTCICIICNNNSNRTHTRSTAKKLVVDPELNRLEARPVSLHASSILSEEHGRETKQKSHDPPSKASSYAPALESRQFMQLSRVSRRIRQCQHNHCPTLPSGHQY